MPQSPLLSSGRRLAPSASCLAHVSSVMEEMVSEALNMAPAEACLAYAPRAGHLEFAGLRKPGAPARIHAYADCAGGRHVCPLAEMSAGSGKTINLSELAAMRQDQNMARMADDLERAAGLTASSTLILPVRDESREVLAVLQMINRTGGAGAFSREDQLALEELAGAAAARMGAAQFMRSMMSGLIAAAALRDPAETSTHADRVGAIAAELYQHMAERRGINPQAMRLAKDQLRIAATLHDIGKIGVPGHILQKPGRLTPEERSIMEHHCAMGAELFSTGRREIDKTVRDVALYHHQRWDGRGYTGDEHIHNLRGEEIPLAARIVSVADVYDALVSRRCYKEPWDHEAAVAAVREEAGTQFDPEVVEAFAQGENIVAAIKECYADRLPAEMIV